MSNRSGTLIRLIRSFTIGLSVAALAAPRQAFAYLDPGVGSYVLQVIIGTIAAAGFGMKLFWGRIREFLSRRFRRERDR